MKKTSHLNTNKQFMIGNGILAFAVIFVVVLFVYLTFRLQQKNEGRRYAEAYTVVLGEGFVGDSLSVLVNDSLLLTTRVAKMPTSVQFTRFAEESSLLLVEHATDHLSVFPLSPKGGVCTLRKEAGKVVMEP